ncbi:hypothetical protein SP60_03820 [Candidatus Thioglobus autotrophicus]|jgi:hypothetical protein|uniref:Uncharacterized protein n=1 Tax=Candidatus Thioglobus autotrophicus TaxID=1705394 RepID=A0A0M4NH10_9GAMM|nr:hypothetical protein SP60_03820 [Candidatus Thioglobus autotrophicus]
MLLFYLSLQVDIPKTEYKGHLQNNAVTIGITPIAPSHVFNRKPARIKNTPSTILKVLSIFPILHSINNPLL